MPTPRYAIGCDFGTESVRAVVVDVADGTLAAAATAAYPHGVIDRALPTGQPLPPDYALQHPADWLGALATACRAAMANVDPAQVVGLGVAFTSCTMLPCRRDGTPLCLTDPFATEPLAWPKLWKHHGAHDQAERMTAVAADRGEPWLARYGGTVGVEWFFPKVLETLDGAPAAYAAADVWVEGGDWVVWQLTGGLVRSTCQAGYKACWNADAGYPSADYFAAVRPDLRDVMWKMPGRLAAPGTRAGRLTAELAGRLGLAAGTPVATATIDAHAGVPGAGVSEAGTLVMVLGTSSCHMLNSPAEHLVPGVAGVVKGGILPGSFGYETGQASVGDALAWVARTVNGSHADLNAAAATLPPGSGGVMAIDWLNGCRTPLMDGRLSGAFVGLTLGTTPAQLYRAVVEATAFGVRWVRDTLTGGGVPVTAYVASGGLGRKSPLLMQIYADVLNAPVELAAVDEPVAVGAAVLGRTAADDGGDVAAAVKAMARRGGVVYQPGASRAAAYDKLYGLYRELGRPDGPVAGVMRSLRSVH